MGVLCFEPQKKLPTDLLKFDTGGSTYLEDHPRTDVYVVKNHGDGFRPLRIGLWDPYQGWP